MTATTDSVIDALGGTGAVSAGLGLPLPTVSSWRKRGIPPRRWPELVRLADELDIEGITFETLASLPAPNSSEARA